MTILTTSLQYQDKAFRMKCLLQWFLLYLFPWHSLWPNRFQKLTLENHQTEIADNNRPSNLLLFISVFLLCHFIILAHISVLWSRVLFYYPFQCGRQSVFPHFFLKRLNIALVKWIWVILQQRTIINHLQSPHLSTCNNSIQ